MQFQKILLVTGMLLMSLVGGVIGGLLVDAPVFAERVQGPGAVTTTQVNLVDADGQLRAVLAGRDERRMASLSFYDPGGQVRGIVGIDESGTPLVRLLDPAGQSRFTALVRGNDPLVIVGDEAAQSAVFGSVGGSPLLSLFDAGQSRTRLQLAPDGSPSFGLFDQGGRQSIALTVDAANAPLMTLHEEGRVRGAFGCEGAYGLSQCGRLRADAFGHRRS